MKHNTVCVIVLLFVIFGIGGLNAGDLFELDGAATTEEQPKDGAAPADGAAPVPGEEQKAPEQANAPQTANLSITEAAADPKAEKELRQLTVEKKQKIKVVEKKEYYKDGRFELGVGFGLISGDWHNVLVPSVQFSYNINEMFAVQGRFIYGAVAIKRETMKQVDEVNANVATSNLSLAGGANFVFTPLYGKMSFFGNWIPKYDLSFNLGGFFYQVNAEKDNVKTTGNNFAVDLGFFGRIFFTNNFFASLNCDWFMMQDKRKNKVGGEVAYLKTDFLFTVNVGMFLPFAD